MSVLNIKDVTKVYEGKVTHRALNQLSFEVEAGEFVAIMGPSGSGKTTLLNLISTIDQPTSGEIMINGLNPRSLSRNEHAYFRRRQLGFVFQDFNLLPMLTVEENIWAILENRPELNKNQRKEKLESLLEEFSITRLAKQQAYSLSGGERRRTEIARALAMEPKFLLLDEPFAGIDPIAVADIKSMIKILSTRGIGVLITDHNVRDTLEITSRAIIISNGQILAQGQKEDILNSEEARKIYLGEEFKM